MSVSATNLFKHRFDTAQIDDLLTVVDQFNLMTLRAKSVLSALYMQFDGDGRINDEHIQSCITTVECEIEDMEALINAHHDSVRKNKGGMQ